MTSPTGAAVHDFLEVLRGRWQGVDVLVVPTKVQGEGAAGEIAAAIALINRLRPALDVLVVTRGGGSMEDLWCFNEESVVRAIHGSSRARGFGDRPRDRRDAQRSRGGCAGLDALGGGCSGSSPRQTRSRRPWPISRPVCGPRCGTGPCVPVPAWRRSPNAGCFSALGAGA